MCELNRHLHKKKETYANSDIKYEKKKSLKAKKHGLTTVWWLTWMTSSPAWIFLQRSARDWRADRESLTAAPLHRHNTASCDTATSLCLSRYKWMNCEAAVYTGEHEEACTYTLCRPGDYVQTVICWFDVHALLENSRSMNYYISFKQIRLMWNNAATQPFAEQTRVIAYLRILAFVLICL